MSVKICLVFIIQVKEDNYRIFWGIAGVQTDNDLFGPDAAVIWAAKIVNITQLLKMFKLMVAPSAEAVEWNVLVCLSL